METWAELEKAVDDGLIKSIGKQRRTRSRIAGNGSSSKMAM